MRTEVGDFIHTVFFFLRGESTLVPHDRKFRMNLNVKKPNKYVLSSRFKMKTLDTCPSVNAKQLIHDQFRFKGYLFYAPYS